LLHLCKDYLTAVKFKTINLLTSDKVLNVLMYRLPFYVVILQELQTSI